MSVKLVSREDPKGKIGYTASDPPYTPPSYRFWDYVIVIKGSDAWKLEQILHWIEISNKTKLTEKDLLDVFEGIIREGINTKWRES